MPSVNDPNHVGFTHPQTQRRFPIPLSVDGSSQELEDTPLECQDSSREFNFPNGP